MPLATKLLSSSGTTSLHTQITCIRRCVYTWYASTAPVDTGSMIAMASADSSAEGSPVAGEWVTRTCSNEARPSSGSAVRPHTRPGCTHQLKGLASGQRRGEGDRHTIIIAQEVVLPGSYATSSAQHLIERLARRRVVPADAPQRLRAALQKHPLLLWLGCRARGARGSGSPGQRRPRGGKACGREAGRLGSNALGRGCRRARMGRLRSGAHQGLLLLAAQPSAARRG